MLTYLNEKGWRRSAFGAPKLLARLLFFQTESTWFSRDVALRFRLNPQQDTLGFKMLPAADSRLPQWIQARKEEFPWIYHPKELETACRENHPYLTVQDGKEIIGFIKLGINRVYIHDFDQIIRFPSESCFIYDSLVLPAYRGRRIVQRALAYAAPRLQSQGLRILWAHIAAYNHASLRAFDYMDFEPRAKIRYVRIHRSWVYVRDGFYPFRNLEALIEEMSRE